jgi:hypothetical protein
VRALLALPSLDIAACDNQGNDAVALARRNGRTELADEIQELVRVLGHALRCPLTLSTNTPPPYLWSLCVWSGACSPVPRERALFLFRVWASALGTPYQLSLSPSSCLPPLPLLLHDS